MAGDSNVDEPMETEILPSTSNDDTRIKEKDSKCANLPWYVLFLRKMFFIFNDNSIMRLGYFCYDL
jgi:hypothetical protein